MANLIEIKNLDIVYKSEKGAFSEESKVYAVNDLSLNIRQGEILALAGESGCGKSSLARALINLTPATGEINYRGKNILEADKKTLKAYRKNAQMVFQNPFSSLNPKMKIAEILAEPLLINTKLKKAQIEKRISDVALQVGFDEKSLKMYPHEFSGGQRQRIAIARALVLNPSFIIADEPVSALDVSIQAQILNLLKSLRDKYNLTILFISHDLRVIKYLADRVAIMYLGEIVEQGTVDEIFEFPAHPYTKALLSAIPQIGEKSSRLILEGDLPSPSSPPSGCKFHTRCPVADSVCTVEIPDTLQITETHSVKCFCNIP